MSNQNERYDGTTDRLVEEMMERFEREAHWKWECENESLEDREASDVAKRTVAVAHQGIGSGGAAKRSEAELGPLTRNLRKIESRIADLRSRAMKEGQ